MMKTNIYAVAHKKFNTSICEHYIPIAVGEKLKNDESCFYLKDCAGDNISEKNPNYCELTALYWIWKNDTVSEIKGICHYRRYFTKYAISASVKGVYTLEEIEKFFSKDGYDMLISNEAYSVRGVVAAYLDCGREKDLAATREVINKMYPDYLDAFDKFFSGCCGPVANMMIAPRKLFDEYSKWLFDILFELEKNTDLSGYTDQEARIYGYISERLLGVYIENHKELKIKRCRILNTDDVPSPKYYFDQAMLKLHINQMIKYIVFQKRKKKGQIKKL